MNDHETMHDWYAETTETPLRRIGLAGARPHGGNDGNVGNLPADAVIDCPAELFPAHQTRHVRWADGWRCLACRPEPTP